jgi:hypothetical protein
VASLFLQIGWNKPALQSRKNSAATSHPPIGCGSLSLGRTFRHPCAVTPLAAGFRCVRACASRASVAPAPGVASSADGTASGASDHRAHAAAIHFALLDTCSK